MDTLCYTQNLHDRWRNRDAGGNRHGYRGTISSTSMNQQAFHISLETLRSIAKQANAGVPIHFGHQTYQFQAGMSTSATLNGEKVISDFYIIEGLDDVNSDDVITRHGRRRTQFGLSIGFYGRRFLL